MQKSTALRVFGTAASLLALGICFIWFAYRPWAINWGATDAEIARAMPGDSIIGEATFSATRAVTVYAAPEHIWPWLVQFGYQRAGLYSYDFLDNDGVPSAEQILPEYQDLKVGDSIPIGPGFFVKVALLEPNREMLLVFPDWAEATWAWGLYPVDDSTTRLVTRLRGRPRGRSRIFADLGEVFPMRNSMLGIKRRAERLATQRAERHEGSLVRSGPFEFSLRTDLLLDGLRKVCRRLTGESAPQFPETAQTDRVLDPPDSPS